VLRSLTLVAVGLVSLVSVACSKRPPSFDRIRLGMTEEEVVSVLGRPSSVSMQQTTRILEYLSWDTNEWGTHINHQAFYVRLMNGKVDSFGRKGDFDSTNKQ